MPISKRYLVSLSNSSAVSRCALQSGRHRGSTPTRSRHGDASWDSAERHGVYVPEPSRCAGGGPRGLRETPGQGRPCLTNNTSNTSHHTHSTTRYQPTGENKQALDSHNSRSCQSISNNYQSNNTSQPDLCL